MSLKDCEAVQYSWQDYATRLVDFFTSRDAAKVELFGGLYKSLKSLLRSALACEYFTCGLRWPPIQVKIALQTIKHAQQQLVYRLGVVSLACERIRVIE